LKHRKNADDFHSPLIRIRSRFVPTPIRSVVNFCEACSPPRAVRYEGSRLILEISKCACSCPNTVFEANGPRCPKCAHLVKIELSDDWHDPFLWIDPKTKGPVRVDEIIVAQ